MNILRIAAVCALVVLTACSGSSTSPNEPAAMPTIGPVSSGTVTIAPSAASTNVTLPSIGGMYGGTMLLPPGSGTATLTFSLSAPPGIPALTEQTPEPQIAYITITAQSAFTLAAYPALNLSVPASYTAIDMWLNVYGTSGWTSSLQTLGWPSTSGVSAVCFKAQSGSIALQPGQSLYLGINGDSVLPTPIASGALPPCPQ